MNRRRGNEKDSCRESRGARKRDTTSSDESAVSVRGNYKEKPKIKTYSVRELLKNLPTSDSDCEIIVVRKKKHREKESHTKKHKKQGRKYKHRSSSESSKTSGSETDSEEYSDRASLPKSHRSEKERLKKRQKSHEKPRERRKSRETSEKWREPKESERHTDRATHAELDAFDNESLTREAILLHGALTTFVLPQNEMEECEARLKLLLKAKAAKRREAQRRADRILGKVPKAAQQQQSDGTIETTIREPRKNITMAQNITVTQSQKTNTSTQTQESEKVRKEIETKKPQQKIEKTETDKADIEFEELKRIRAEKHKELRIAKITEEREKNEENYKRKIEKIKKEQVTKRVEELETEQRLKRMSEREQEITNSIWAMKKEIEEEARKILREKNEQEERLAREHEERLEQEERGMERQAREEIAWKRQFLWTQRRERQTRERQTEESTRRQHSAPGCNTSFEVYSPRGRGNFRGRGSRLTEETSAALGSRSSRPGEVRPPPGESNWREHGVSISPGQTLIEIQGIMYLREDASGKKTRVRSREEAERLEKINEYFKKNHNFKK